MTDQPLLVLLAFAATLAAGAVRAQSPETTLDPAYTNLSDYLIEQNRPAADAAVVNPQDAAGGNFSSVTQTGSGNTATVAISGASNVSAQTQTGADNISTLSISGAFNNVSSTQIGTGDSFSLKLNGSANSVTQTQNGNNLTFGLTIAGNGKSVTVTQIGGR